VPDVLTADDLERRVERLEVLAKGLGKEVYLWRQADDPLLYLERRKYLCALQDALFGVEGARVALAKALARLGEAGAADDAA
jgi:hypothetical protein